MALVDKVEIRNFRSLRSVDLADFGQYLPIVGLNSSGKSNMLRALNLFFNGVIDDEVGGVVLSRDYSDYAPSGKKRRISVGVRFVLGDPVAMPKLDVFFQGAGLTNRVAIRKTWSLDSRSQALIESFEFGPDFDQMAKASSDDVQNLLVLVRSVTYRYVPNHVRPAELMRRLLLPLRGELVARLQSTKEYKASAVDDLMSGLIRMGAGMFDTVSSRVKAGLPHVTLAPDLPGTFADLAFDVALSSVSDNGVSHTPDLEGSGTQAFMLLHVLDLADRSNRRGSFGWNQGSIWAFEEPESFLHSSLRSRMSQDLVAYADSDRRQVFVTTHHDEFVRVARHAAMATRGTEGTSLRLLAARAATEEGNRKGITTFQHPLLMLPETPLVIVEGAFDAIYLRAALEKAGLRPRWRLVSPDADLSTGTAGDALKKYLQFSTNVLASRPTVSPVIVLRDWEATDASEYDKHLSVHPYSKALVSPASMCNPDLGPSFRGIERYLPTDLVERVAGGSALGRESAEDGGALSIAASKLKSVKQDLARSVEGGEDCGPHMQVLAKWLDDAVESILGTIPASEFA